MENVKRIKVFRTTYFLSVVAALMLFISSCEKEDSAPESGSDDRAKYLGNWICNETSAQHGSSTYTITISKDVTTSDKIKAQNFYQLGNSAYVFMIVDGNNMTIQQQVISPDTLSGSGTYNSNTTLSFNFTNRDGQTLDNVTVTAHR